MLAIQHTEIRSQLAYTVIYPRYDRLNLKSNKDTRAVQQPISAPSENAPTKTRMNCPILCSIPMPSSFELSGPALYWSIDLWTQNIHVNASTRRYSQERIPPSCRIKIGIVITVEHRVCWVNFSTPHRNCFPNFTFTFYIPVINYWTMHNSNPDPNLPNFKQLFSRP